MANLKDTHGLYPAVSQTLSMELQDSERRLSFLNRAWEACCGNDPVTFEVLLKSRWYDHGEVNIRARSTRSLKHAIRQAQARFKKANNRSDVQAQYIVRVLFDTKKSGLIGHSVVVAGSFYSHLI
jgi:hypothetical protein